MIMFEDDDERGAHNTCLVLTYASDCDGEGQKIQRVLDGLDNTDYLPKVLETFVEFLKSMGFTYVELATVNDPEDPGKSHFVIHKGDWKPADPEGYTEAFWEGWEARGEADQRLKALMDVKAPWEGPYVGEAHSENQMSFDFVDECTCPDVCKDCLEAHRPY